MWPEIDAEEEEEKKEEEKKSVQTLSLLLSYSDVKENESLWIYTSYLSIWIKKEIQVMFLFAAFIARVLQWRVCKWRNVHAQQAAVNRQARASSWK